MFGMGFRSKVKSVLKKEFKYYPDPLLEPILKKIVQEAKSSDLNEFDAAIMFMLVQMNSLDDGEGVKEFVELQSEHIKRCIPLALNDSNEVSKMLNAIRLKHGLESSQSNREEHGELAQINRVAEASYTLIRMQILMAEKVSNVLMEKLTSPFARGYIWGVCDCTGQFVGLNNDDDICTAIAGVFQHIYGGENCRKWFNLSMDEQRLMSGEFYNGSITGRQDVVDFHEVNSTPLSLNGFLVN